MSTEHVCFVRERIGTVSLQFVENERSGIAQEDMNSNETKRTSCLFTSIKVQYAQINIQETQ